VTWTTVGPRMAPHSPGVVDNAAEVLRTVDGILLPHGFLTDLPCTDLYEDAYVWPGLRRQPEGR
jgi:hypothetical protein